LYQNISAGHTDEHLMAGSVRRLSKKNFIISKAQMLCATEQDHAQCIFCVSHASAVLQAAPRWRSIRGWPRPQGKRR
jgi:hypothetical protein